MNLSSTVEGSPVLIVSDIHYERAYHRGVWEGDAFNWLTEVVRSSRPAALIALGDLGHAWLPSDWERLAELTSLNAIYGNHDDLEVLRAARNRDGSRVLAEDGEVRVIGGLKVGFINGIMANKGKVKVKDGVPRQSAEDFLSAAAKLVGVDVLATHASPYLPEYGNRALPWPRYGCSGTGPYLPEHGNRYHASMEFEVLDRVLAQVNPKLSVSGHLSGPYTLSKLRDTTVLRIDSSPAERHYALVDPAGRIRVMRDHEQVKIGSFVRSS